MSYERRYESDFHAVVSTYDLPATDDGQGLVDWNDLQPQSQAPSIRRRRFR